MTISAHQSGTQTATINTEHFLSSPNVEGKFTGIVDVSNMADGDIVELRAYQMVLTGGTPRVVDFIVLYGAQPADQQIVQWGKDLKNELVETNALRYSLKQTAGTGRSFPWKVIKDSDQLIKIAVDNIETSTDTFLDATISSRATPANVATALADIKLDKLVANDIVGGLFTVVANDSVIGHMLDVGDGSYSRLSDSMQIMAGDVAVALTAIGAIRVKKNTALNNFMFLMRSSGDHVTPATGLTVTAQRSIDGAAFGNCSNPVTEVGNGVYKINLSAGDLNGDVITLKFTATGADQRTITIVTQQTV